MRWQRDALHATLVDPAKLLGCGGKVPQRQDARTDDPLGIGRLPLVDEPIVVRAHQRQRVGPVLDLDERGAGEPGQRRERHLRVDAVDVHVLDTLARVVTALPHRVEGLGLRAELGFLLAGGR